MVSRRLLLAGSVGLVVGPARAGKIEAAAAIRALTGGVVPRVGRVVLEVPLLVENGNAVAMNVGVAEALPAAGRVVSLHVVAEGNPQPQVIDAYFGPRSGAARFSTRIRLATSQSVVAVAVCADGTVWMDSVELLVTLAACVDGI